MSNFEPNKEHLRHVMIFLFNQKKKALEIYRILLDLWRSCSNRECWFQRFKSGDFNVIDKERENRQKKFENDELQALLDEDDIQTQQMMAVKCHSASHFRSLESHRKDSKGWKIGSTQTERTTDGKMKNCVRNAAFTPRKKGFFASGCNWR